MNNMSTRTKILFGLLVLIVAGWGATHMRNRALAAELEEVAADKLAELSEAVPMNAEMASVVTPAQEYVLFGEARGKIAIYTRGPGDSEISGVEYFLVREGGDWRVTESSHCADEQCQTEGRRVLDRRPKPIIRP